VDVWVKAFMAMGLLFSVGSTFSLAKTVRDQHESESLRKRIAEGAVEKIVVALFPGREVRREARLPWLEGQRLDIFVPALAIFLDEPQLEAEATSLLAIIPVAIVATWRQHRYGNLRLREGLLIGALSPVGVVIGVVAANELSERALELSFAALALLIAARLFARALRPADPAPPSGQPENPT
jgi:hypothetical protein